MNVPDAPLDNISFHSVDGVERWRFVYQRRVALSRELGQYDFKIKEIMELISEVVLMRIVTGFAKCYDVMFKELMLV